MMMNFRRIAAGSLHLLQKSAMRPALFPRPSDSGVIARLRWTTRALSSTTESGETAATTSPSDSNEKLLSWVNSLHKEGKHEDLSCSSLSSSDEEQETEKELTFEEIHKLRADGSKSVPWKPIQVKKTGRANKNRPMELSSKKPVSRYREVVQVPKKVVRDPRFDSLGGNLDFEGFRKRYNFFFEDKLPAEREELKKQLKKSKNLEEGHELKNQLTYVEKMLKYEPSTKNKGAAILTEHKNKEREAAKEGKRPYYLKKCSLHLLQKSATRPALFPRPSDSGVIARLRWTTRALSSTSESGETAATTTTSDPKEGFVFSNKDKLLSWVNSLHKEGKHEFALHLFDYMDEKKVEFTPSEFALYMEILAKVKGLRCAFNYFKKVNPDFNNQDHHAKNWLAYATLVRLNWEHLRKAGFRPLTLPCCYDKSSGSKLHAHMKRMDPPPRN